VLGPSRHREVQGGAEGAKVLAEAALPAGIEAEAAELGPPVHQQDVGRAHAVVDDVPALGELEDGEQLEPDRGGLVGRQGAVGLDHLGQGPGRDQLGHDEEVVAVPHGVEDGDGARERELDGGPGLAQQRRPGGLLLAGRELDLLDGDVAAQDGVLGPPDCSGAALPEPCRQRVPPGDDALRRRDACQVLDHDRDLPSRAEIVGRLTVLVPAPSACAWRHPANETRSEPRSPPRRPRSARPGWPAHGAGAP
jgi:hypothetical protein